ncbi:MAG TPA: serine hydrolase domain-containing protein [Thermoanaerobaculia bacterium]|nr:serine hydrolase domain-containing protein [Thermoanaerobaculia bacterium]
MGTELKKPLLSRSAAVLLATVLLTPARWAVAAPAIQRAAAEQIAEILEARQREQHIPGFAFALVRQDRLELVIVRGVRDVERALPVTPDTVFPIGSCTKAFTSMAMAKHPGAGTHSRLHELPAGSAGGRSPIDSPPPVT